MGWGADAMSSQFPLLGCIADDLTGAVDLAGRLVREGAVVELHIGSPEDSPAVRDADALIVALKSRSIEPPAAIVQSIRAAQWLQDAGCTRFYFKYCSTFDSTPRGNIGPVADALIRHLDVPMTVLAPAFPENGRTVSSGVLYVNGIPLASSPMKDHPLNPMRESSILSIIGQQSPNRATGITIDVVRNGAEAVAHELRSAADSGYRYVVLDAENDDDISILGRACASLALCTGGSALAGEIMAELLTSHTAARGLPAGARADVGRDVVLAGSMSTATRAQVTAFRQVAPSFSLAAAMVHGRASAVDKATTWARQAEAGAPLLIYSTPQPDESNVMRPDGAEVEAAFAEIAERVVRDGVTGLVVAGGETSGAVVQALGLLVLDVGPEIQPGVPVAFGQTSTGRRVGVVLKSGNFGDERFFAEALGAIRE